MAGNPSRIIASVQNEDAVEMSVLTNWVARSPFSFLLRHFSARWLFDRILVV